MPTRFRSRFSRPRSRKRTSSAMATSAGRFAWWRTAASRWTPTRPRWKRKSRITTKFSWRRCRAAPRNSRRVTSNPSRFGPSRVTSSAGKSSLKGNAATLTRVPGRSPTRSTGSSSSRCQRLVWPISRSAITRQRSDRMTVRVLSVAILLGLAQTAFAQKPSPADLATQSRAILSKRCGECHGDQLVRTQLGVLNYAQMVAKRDVPFIQANDVDASQVLELIEQGSMPPGLHPKVPADELDVLRKWVNAGAGAYPAHFDDAYAYDAILSDLSGDVPVRDVPLYRYLTLHHLAEDATTTDFIKARADFLRDLPKVFSQTWGGPQTVDAHGTIFRINLRDVGWDHKPFVKIDSDGKDNGPSHVNVFDVVLLEYPYLRLPSGSATFEKIGAKLLKPAKQVRPAPFVRGDWFIQATTTTSLGKDLATLLNLGKDTPPGLSAPKSETTVKPKPLAGALRAVDAWHGLDPAEVTAVKGLKVETTADWPTVPGLMGETIDVSRNMPRDKFYGGERVRLRVSADDKMYFQLVWLSAKNQVSRWPPTEKYESPGKAWETVLPGTGIDDVLDPEELGTEKLMVFASKEDIPTIEAIRARGGEVERFYHPFFELKATANGFAPDLAHAKVTRRTVTITVLDPKLKK